MKISAIKNIANIGAGTMGHATALQFAMHGYSVNVLDTSDDALKQGLEKIKNDLKTFSEADILSESATEILKRLHFTTDYKEALNSADFVIESVVEDMTVKKSVWQEVEQYVPDDTIMATNTSGLSPSEIQSVLNQPERFVVAHFWNPAQLMPLVEVVPGKQTSQQTVDTTVELMNRIGKHAVPLKKESLGFVGNRIQLAVLREAFNIINEGIASPQSVDDIVKYSLGRRWSLVGPVASADLGGLDVFKNISSYLYADLSAETGTDPTLSKLVAKNKLGLKTGEGFFNWNGDEGQKMVQQRDKELLQLLKADLAKQKKSKK
ncbi:3-hydroxyacyl-CoA dehydrogenase family protein [Secundilactobacillus mixtipabuli]|uniref:L-gulonate 3-dehydrogenase n=1 Tax=Secundilactobacillus mixtipabuli TaxID=1435342 RepID=A0A1Z5I9Q1_9LACO|nr:3-hydroxyacyl-CoA dehydrogenase family protein [Secundilactobacillus mixtipabuli]GAW98479.1 3-hydroxybutyryl-CoA dehydrogenase [Secundilactobacillus mixtipabuli]